MSDTISVLVTDLSGETQSYEGLEGYSVMEVIRDNGLPIKAECGGCKCCATCAVEVAPEWLDKIRAADADETDLVADSGMSVTPQTRLSCQIILDADLSGLAVTLRPLS